MLISRWNDGKLINALRRLLDISSAEAIVLLVPCAFVVVNGCDETAQ